MPKGGPGDLARFGDKRHAAWKKGENPGTRISNFAQHAVRQARRWCPEAVKYCYEVMTDTSEETTLRLKAADLILHHGMPRGDNSKYLGEETIGTITLNLVMPVLPEEKPKPTIDATPLSIETITVGSGD